MLMWLRSQPIARTLPALIVLTALAVGGAIAFVALGNAEHAMRAAAVARLESLKDSRRLAVAEYIANLENDIVGASQRSIVRWSLQSMATEFGAFDAEARARIIDAYTKNNPYPGDYRAALEDAGDESAYSGAHRNLHRELQQWIIQSGVYDVLLVDTRGNVVYTVDKEKDFGTNLISGEFADTTAARAFLHIAAHVPSGRAYLRDFEVYAPSGSPAAFIGTPVVSDAGERLGVFLVQLGPAFLNRIMKNPVGLGETGETELIGSDLFLRADTRNLPDNSVLRIQIDTPNTRLAVSGVDGVSEAIDFRGKLVLAAYGPLDIRTIRWGVVAKQDVDEINAPIRQLQRLTLAVSLGLIVLFAVLGAFYARRITRPLAAVQDVMTALSAGERATAIPYLERTDEIGRMTNALQVFQQALVKNDQLNETIRTAETRLLNMLDRSPIGVMVQNRDGIIRFINELSAVQLGSTRDQALGSNIVKFTRAKNKHDWDRLIETYRRQGSVRDIEVDFEVLSTGKTATFSVTAERMTFGDETCMLMWATDVTERNRAAEQLKLQAATLAASETQLLARKTELEIEIDKSQALLEGAPDATIIVDKSATIRIVNRATETLFGYRRDELIGQPIEILIPRRYHADHPKLRNAYIDNPAPREMGAGRILSAITKDGREFPVEISLSPIGSAGLVASSVRDVTARRAAEEELKRAKEAAEEATRAKSSFLAMMSHEIRTPMNGVMSMAEVLDQTDLNEDQRSMTRVILDSADALRTVINDILDFSKIEAGKLDIETVELDLGDLVESVGDLLAPRAEEKWLEFHIDIDPAMPRRLRGDPSRIRQILLNLCSNGLKFTEEGSVQIRVSGRRDGDRCLCRFEIVDTGIGLTPEQQSRLFQAFVQAEASTSRRFGGSGLGLTISRRLCELMGGTIGVDSESGKGSTFWFELALPVVDARPYASEIDVSSAKVVLVDYGRSEARILQSYLRHVGIKDIYFAPPPGEQIPLAQALQRIDKPMDLVIVNAREGANRAKKVLDELKLHNATRGARDVVAAPHLAASILRADAKSLSDIQWLATLTTPIRMRRLWQVVGAALGKIDLAKIAEQQQQRQAEYMAPELDVAAAANAVILVAEDNATNRVVIKRVLGRLGYAHEIAENGAAALRLWEENRARYGIVLTDFHMPEMDGFELTHALREREKAGSGTRVPIVALTADVLPQTEQDCLAAGMDGYLRKPIELPALIQALERWLPQALPLRRDVNAPQQKAKPAPQALPAAPKPVDHAVISQQIGTEDMGEHLACLSSFWESCGQGPSDVQAALATRDAKTVRQVSHGLKGAAAMIGATKLAETLGAMEYAARDGDLKTVEDRMSTLQADYRDLRRYLDTLIAQPMDAAGS